MDALMEMPLSPGGAAVNQNHRSSLTKIPVHTVIDTSEENGTAVLGKLSATSLSDDFSVDNSMVTGASKQNDDNYNIRSTNDDATVASIHR